MLIKVALIYAAWSLRSSVLNPLLRTKKIVIASYLNDKSGFI